MKVATLFALVTALAVAAFGQDSAPKAQLKLDKTSAKAGSVIKGKLLLTFGDGLHGYQNPPTDEYQIPVKVEAVKGTTLTKTTYPKGVPFSMAGEAKPSMVYEGDIEIPIEIKVGAKAGKQTIKLTVNYQQCNESSCYPPGKVDVSATVTVTAATPTKKTK